MSQRGNRPKVKSGFNPFTWYNENKNKVIKVTPAGAQLIDPAASSVAAPPAQNPAAPAQPAVKNNGSNGARGENRSGVKPVNGSYRTAVEQGPDGGATPSSGNAGSGTPKKPSSSERTNENGIVQKGLTLGGIDGLFASLNSSGKITEGGLQSANKFFSEALVTTPQAAYQGGELNISTKDTGYEVGAPVTKGTKIDGSQVSYQDVPGYEVPETSVPMTVGRDGDDPQEGVSDKPDIADNIRTVRMHRNKRDQLEGFSVDEPFGGVSETKGNGMSKERMAARSAFLDPNNKGYAAIRARDRAVGAFDQNGTGGMRIDDEFVQFNQGMSADARFELAGGGVQSKEDAQEFLKKYTNRMAKPEASEE